jgi:hypothetical protein
MKITRDKLHDIFGIIFISAGLIILIGMVSEESIGKFGGMVHFLYSVTFGRFVSFTIPLFLFFEGYFFIKMKSPMKHAKNFITFSIFSAVISSFIGIYKTGGSDQFFKTSSFEYGDLTGTVGFYSGKYLYEFLGHAGSIISLAALFLIVLLIIFDFRVMQMARVMVYPFVKVWMFLLKIYISLRKFQERRKLEKERLRKSEEAQIEQKEKYRSEEELEHEADPDDVEISEEIKDEDTGKDKEFDIEDAVVEKTVNYKPKVNRKYKYVPPDIEFLNESKINANIIEDDQKLRDVGETSGIFT